MTTPAELAADPYAPVPGVVATLLGCTTAPDSPVCEVAPPTFEEDSAFVTEGERLSRHKDNRCRELGTAILENRSRVSMYRKALIRLTDAGRLYGVGHAYTIGTEWAVRVARRLDDLNERTLDEKKRTLRHEMSHTIGATEESVYGWSAEEYATRCG